MLDPRAARPLPLVLLVAGCLASRAAAQSSFDPAVSVSGTGTYGQHVLLADVDGDGLDDVVYTAQAPARPRWHRNLGGLSFGAGTELPVFGQYDRMLAAAAADFDLDGDVDLYWGQENYDPSLGISHEFVLLKNDGSGSFAMSPAPGVLYPTDARLDDMNGDGFPDLLVCGDTGVYYTPNSGAGAFLASVLVTNALVRPRCVRAGDVNGDGRPDVLSCSYDDRVVWMENLDGASFGPPQDVTTLHLNPYSIATGDVDGDGDQDVIVASGHESAPSGQPPVDGIVAWYENEDGAGTFGPQRALVVEFPGGATDVQIADLDADGYDDAVWAKFYVVQWSQGGPSGLGTPQELPLTDIAGRRSAIGDVDGDHRLDVAVAMQNSGLVDLFRQQPNTAAAEYCGGPSLLCPCGNAGGDREGCANSTGAGGYLEWSGTDSLASDDMTLRAFQCRPGMPALLLQGGTQTSSLFRDGVLCVGNPTDRLQFVTLDAEGGAMLTQHLGSLSTGAAPGVTLHYQMWYRDPMGSTCGTGSNLTGAITVAWQ